MQYALLQIQGIKETKLQTEYLHLLSLHATSLTVNSIYFLIQFHSKAEYIATASPTHL